MEEEGVGTVLQSEKSHMGGKVCHLRHMEYSFTILGSSFHLCVGAQVQIVLTMTV